jgi:16S rRNA (cytidine1402-2'-O)-methyltransferase
VADFLQDALAVFGDRQAALANDLTKMFEKVERGSLTQLLATLGDAKLKGEYIIVIAGNGKGAKREDASDDDQEE